MSASARSTAPSISMAPTKAITCRRQLCKPLIPNESLVPYDPLNAWPSLPPRQKCRPFASWAPSPSLLFGSSRQRQYVANAATQPSHNRKLAVPTISQPLRRPMIQRILLRCRVRLSGTLAPCRPVITRVGTRACATDPSERKEISSRTNAVPIFVTAYSRFASMLSMGDRFERDASRHP